MSSDFSTKGRSARELIPVPVLPMESIRSRSHADRNRGRMRIFSVCAAIALAALGAGTGVGAKIYDGVRVWLSPGKEAMIVPSGVLMRRPMAADLRKAIASATFPVVFPVGVPAGSRVYMVTLAPAERPSAITVSYQNEGAGLKYSFALLDPAVVAGDDVAVPANAGRPAHRARDHWRVGGEIVATGGDNLLPTGDLDRVKAAMSQASPADSLAATEAMLPTIVVLGDPVRLAIAEHYRPSSGRSVLLGQSEVRSIARLVKRRQPLLDWRITTIRKIVYAKGDISRGVARQSKVIAVSADGVRAIDAVLRSGGNARADCGCEILFNQPSSGTYWVWNIPMSSSGEATKFAVDARTFAVTTSPEGDARQ